MVEIRDLRKSYGKLAVLKGVSLELRAGEIVAIVGPNAAGKSTLIKCVLGLVIPDSGEIIVKGQHVRAGWAYRRDVGYMAQIARFPEHLTVAELVELVQDIRGEHAEASLRELLGFFGLEPFLKQTLRALSGGTRQKVNALVAMLFDPSIYLLDEPTAGLDPLASSRLKDRILSMRRADKLVVISSHYTSELEDLADRVIFMLEGEVRFDGPTAKLTRMTGEPKLERSVAKLMQAAPS